MTTITVSTNAGNIRNGLNNVAMGLPRITKKQIRAAMEGARKVARGNWPSGGGPGGYSIPQPSGTKYKRAGEYGRKMTIMESGLSFILRSDARRNGRLYPQFVGGDAFGARQSRVHAGRWPLLKDAVAARIRDLVAAIENDIEIAARAAGVGM